MSDEWQQRVDDLWARYDSLDPDDLLARFKGLAAERPPGDPLPLFELASAHDSTDHEAEAAPLYRAALTAGLTGLTRRRAVIQLASTLRNLGEAEESVALLTAERAMPSDELDDAVAAFLALALIDEGKPRAAASLALNALSKHLPRYNRSLANYARAITPE